MSGRPVGDSPPALEVLFTTPWGENAGGSEQMLRTLVLGLDPRRIRPTVVFLQAGGLERELAAAGVRTRVVAAGRLRQGLRAIRAVRRLARLFRAERPDLVINWSAKTHLYGAPAALLAGSLDRLAWWQHGIPGGGRLDRTATLLPAAAIGCSSEAAARAQAVLWPRRPTFVVHPGTAVAEPFSAESELRKRFAIPKERSIVGLVGRLQPWKGQLDFVRAIHLLRRQGRDVHGLLVGGDSHGLSPGYRAEIDDLVERLGLGDRLSVTGVVSDATAHMVALDVLVHASRNEPFGIVLIEAMALGIPIVAADEGGPLEILDDGQTGILVPSSRSDRMAEAVATLLDDPDLRRRLAGAARTRFEAAFTVDHFVERFERSVEALVESRRRVVA